MSVLLPYYRINHTSCIAITIADFVCVQKCTGV